MRIRLLPSAHLPSSQGGADPLPAPQPLTTFVVEGAGGAGPIAIDAGSLGLVGEPEEMARIRGVALTHAHIDHVASLPMFAEALLSRGIAPVRIHASAGAVADLRAHLFNGALFPDFEALSDDAGRPLLELLTVAPDAPFELGGFTLRPFPADHPVPTQGYVVDDGEVAVAFAADGGPNPGLWELCSRDPRVRAVVLEASFPDRLSGIATGSGHLTPGLLASEIARAPGGLRVLVTHMKPAYRGEVDAAVRGLADDRVTILDPGETVTI